MGHPPTVTRWGLVLGLLAVLALPAPAAAGGTIYLSLGTSLSVGIQPDEDGDNQLTNQGYADQLYRLLRLRDPKLQLVKLGCPAETSSSMIDGEGSLCTYPFGSQLKQAVAFLTANPGAVKLLTLDVSPGLRGA